MAVSEKQRFIAAEREQESGGDYHAVNASSGALGAWQVMPANLPGWLARSGQPPMSDAAYLDCHACQDRLAWVILGGYYDTFGAAGAAAEWYSGQSDPNKTYGDPPVDVYVRKVLALMGDPNLKTGNIPPGGGLGAGFGRAGHELATAAQELATLAGQYVQDDMFLRNRWRLLRMPR
jgi:hypothetical protein